MGELKRLPDSELDIMLAVWSKKGPVTAPELMEKLERPITASALHSYLKRLEEKRFLACEKRGKINRYTPLVSKAAYQEEEGKTILSKLYSGSLKRFAAALHDGGSLEREEIAELRAYLEELEEGEGEESWKLHFFE